MTDSSLSRLQAVLERIRAEHHPDLASEVVERLGEIEDEHLYSPDVTARRNEVSRLVETEVTRQELTLSSTGADPDEGTAP